MFCLVFLQDWVFLFLLCVCVFSEKLLSPSWTCETHMSVCKRRFDCWTLILNSSKLVWEIFSFSFFGQIGLRLCFCIFFLELWTERHWFRTILKSQQIFWSESFDSELTLTESIQWILNIWFIWLKRLLHFEGKEWWVIEFVICCFENIVYCFLQFYWVINKLSLLTFPISFILLFHFRTKYMTIVLNWIDLMSPTSWHFKKRVDYKHCHTLYVVKWQYWDLHAPDKLQLRSSSMNARFQPMAWFHLPAVLLPSLQ